MKLADFQCCFANGLLNGKYEDVLGWLCDDQFSPASLLDIYRDSVFTSLTSVLSDTFPDLKQALGEEDFSDAARAFIRAHPPAGPLLDNYGTEFAPFVAARAAENKLRA